MADEQKADEPKLTDKQRMFCEHYIACRFNATQAARLAGYKGDDNVLGVQGHENLRNPKIRAYIDARFEEVKMGANEVLSILSEHARGTIDHFITRPDDDEMGEGAAFIDLNRPSARANMHLLKKAKCKRRSFKERDPDDPESLRPVTETEFEVELHDPQAALVHLGRHHKLFTDKTEVTGKDGGPIKNESVGNPDERTIGRIADLLERAGARRAGGDAG